jgi:ketosteroid isomerase-like protein
VIRTFLAVVVLVGVAASHPIHSQTSPDAMPVKDLKEAITGMDAKMFEAFNAHNVDLLMSMFTSDLEFYDDSGGLTNLQQTREDFTTMFGNMPDIRRTLVAGSVQVYPVKDYGAIETGTHRFCHQENGRDDCGEFPFVMVWKKIGASWKVSRVISYGH